MILVGAGAVSLFVLAVGLVAFATGVQGTHISIQTIVYALRRAARSRLNSAYITPTPLRRDPQRPLSAGTPHMAGPA
jgi:hypothetical protein